MRSFPSSDLYLRGTPLPSLAGLFYAIDGNADRDWADAATANSPEMDRLE